MPRTWREIRGRFRSMYMFHVITSSSGEGNVDDASIAAQIDVLNASYSGATGGSQIAPLDLR